MKGADILADHNLQSTFQFQKCSNRAIVSLTILKLRDNIVEKVGFIGLGNMGLPMARNLLDAGYEVRGYDVGDAARSAAENAGIRVSVDTASAVADSAITITMLPNGEIAKAVVAEALPHMPQDSLLIDCSTIDVGSAREIHDAASHNKTLCLDAPVSGGVAGADAGSLTFMAGGTSKAFDRAKPLLACMGQKTVHCGDGGAGQAAKMCNNMLLAISMIGTCEAFALAEKVGLDRQRLFDVMSTSSGSCWSVNNYCPVPQVGPKTPADDHYKPGFAASLMLKDLKLAMQASDEVGADTYMGEQAMQLYATMNDLGHGESDFSGIINFLSEISDKRG